MVGFQNVREVVNAELDGKVRRYGWRKSPSAVTAQRYWFDMSMSPGNPVPKFWFDAPPLVSKAVYQSTDGGLFHGAGVSPSQKYLRMITALTDNGGPLPMQMVLCDYLLYYPTCDDGTTDEQLMTNSVSLPRYSTGEGVQILAISIAARTGGQSFTVNYTNSEGVSGRTTLATLQNGASFIGAIQNNPIANVISAQAWLPLQQGDSGVRSIESVTMQGVDIGLFSLVLVKPLATIVINEVGSPYEKDFILNQLHMPQIFDDAYLNWICIPGATLSGTVVQGDIKVTWT